MGKRTGINDKYEKFASLIVEGKDASSAYRDVYPRSRNWKPASVANKAYALLKKDGIQEILARRRAKAEEDAQVRAVDAILRLKPVLLVSESDYYGEGGEIKEMTLWTHEMRLAFKRFLFDSNGNKTGVELHDVIRVVERLSRMLGWDSSNLNIKGEGIQVNYVYNGKEDS